MSVAAIKTEELRKVFGDRAAVKGLTLQVEQGEVFGFLGPNGAGKTTSIKMLLGLVKPTSGTASLLGAPISDRATRARSRLFTGTLSLPRLVDSARISRVAWGTIWNGSP